MLRIIKESKNPEIKKTIMIWGLFGTSLSVVWLLLVMVLISGPSEMGRVILTSILSGWAGEKILVNLTSKEKVRTPARHQSTIRLTN